VVVAIKEEADHAMEVRWNLAAMTKEDVKAAEKIRMEQANKRAPLHAKCTANEVEEEAVWCQEVMGSIRDATVQRISICAKAKRLWNADIKERRNVVGRQKKRRLNMEQAARAKAELQQSIWYISKV